MKYLILDAGPIISLTMNGLLWVLEKLKQDFDGEFIITPEIKQEVIDNPFRIKRFELEAIQVKNLIDKKVLKLSTEIVNQQKLEKETNNVIREARLFLKTTDTNEQINLIHKGEASCIAFSRLCGAENLIVADERTVRWLTELPEGLEELMEKKLHTSLVRNELALKSFRNIRYIRSTELLFVAYKKGLMPFKDKMTLDALLYGAKFKGTAITSTEIEEMKRM